MPRHDLPIIDVLRVAEACAEEIVRERDALLEALRICAMPSTPQHERERLSSNLQARVTNSRIAREQRLREAGR